MIGDKAMTEFELMQRLNFEIDQLEMLSHYLKELAKSYEDEREYYGKKLAALEDPLTIEPIVSMYKVHKDADFSSYHLNIALRRLEKTQKRLEKLNEDIALNGVEL